MANRQGRSLEKFGFLAPTGVGERWLGQAETERGNGAGRAR